MPVSMHTKYLLQPWAKTTSTGGQDGNLIDIFGYVATLCSATGAIPQLITIWCSMDENLEAVSRVTYGIWGVGACFWLVQAVYDKNTPLIVSSSLSIVLTSVTLLRLLAPNAWVRSIQRTIYTFAQKTPISCGCASDKFKDK